MNAREDARAAALTANVQVRSLASLDEADEAIKVMIATWGDHQLIPVEVFRAFQMSGNLVQGAFRGAEMVGFTLAWWGRDDEGWHLHSHMSAVLPDVRSAGVGFALKLAQRAEALDAGVPLIRWTFDPLQSRNAYFNLAKLGAVADAFHRDFYGQMPDDLNAGDRSDRLVVRWDLEPVLPTAAPSEPADAVEVLARAETVGEAPVPKAGGAPDPDRPALVRIPRDYPAIKEQAPDLAERWREASAATFRACFEAGLIATGYTKDSTYLFGRRP
jgi:predicted GNAT superfamily acetyltransferase